MIYISTEVTRLKADVLWVLMALFSRLEEGNRVMVSPTEMGRQLEVPRVIVSSAIRHLVRVGAMGKGTREGGDRRSYQMSPNLVWKGTPEAHELALEKYDRMKAAGITRVLSTPPSKKVKTATQSSRRRLQPVPHLPNGNPTGPTPGTLAT